MKRVIAFCTVIFFGVLTGCAPKVEEKEPLAHLGETPSHSQDGEKILITVDFREGQTLRYSFVSRKDIKVDWDPTKSSSKRNRRKVDESYELMNMVIDYTPIEVDAYGLTTVKATCKSVQVSRSSGRTGKEAIKNLMGKSFVFNVDPTGKIEDYSQLEKLIKEIGKKAFRPESKRGRIKEPDMISDFITTQWFLWDSISSIEKAVDGVSVGQSWKSILLIPTPMVTRKARNVTYTLDEVRQSEKGQLAVIRSTYSLADSIPASWPVPYSGSFQMSGKFGFLRNYRFLDLKGKGEEIFNIDAGRIEHYNQRYQLQMDASILMGISRGPRITIQQNLTMKLIE